MPKIGKFESKRTGIVADISMINVNGDPVYLCKINGKVYKMTPEDFQNKWKKHVPRRGKVEQEKLL